MIKTYKAGKKYIELKDKLVLYRAKRESFNSMIEYSSEGSMDYYIRQVTLYNTKIKEIEEELLK